MISREQLEHQHEIRGKLLAIGADRAERDRVIRDGARAGISVSEIARLLGLSRQHVSMIAHQDPS